MMEADTEATGLYASSHWLLYLGDNAVVESGEGYGFNQESRGWTQKSCRHGPRSDDGGPADLRV